MPRVLVTGATGLVGRALCPRLEAAGYTVRAALRSDGELPCVHETFVTGDIAAFADWSRVLAGVDLVVHAAALAHTVMAGPRAQQLYHATNVAATARLAAAAVREGVTRFVYLSSIKVNGEDSGEGAFTAQDLARPVDAYGQSKLDAETELRKVAELGAMQLAIVRPPLIYGPGVRANFLRLLRWIDRQCPLPFGSIRNRRSLASVWNLNELILKLLVHPDAADHVWLVHDGEDLATPELVRRIARALGRPARLLRMPPGLLQTFASVAGRGAEVRRLTGSLVVDASPARELLNWHPAISLDEGLARTAAWYRTQWPA
jgi:nucleoside-diphosphate-sugar epimerase